MSVGDKVQYTKNGDVVTILKIKDGHALIQFQSGTKIATPLTGLYPIVKVGDIENKISYE